MSGKISTYIVDAFVTEREVSGNPAGVCFLENNQEFPDDVKQEIATKLKLPTTAFAWTLQPTDNFKTGDRFGLQWFSPTVQIDLCGHALIALAKVLFDIHENENNCVTFVTPLAGEVQAWKKENGLLAIEFPNHEPENIDEERFANLIKVSTGGHPYVDVKFSPPTKKLLIRFDDSMTRLEFENLNPCPLEMLRAADDGSIRGLILTLKATATNEGYDFTSRYFTPWNGIDEDHVCGSAHAVLGPYWQKVLGTNRELRAKQSSKRGGDLIVTMRKDNRVEIAGRCKIVMKI